MDKNQKCKQAYESLRYFIKDPEERRRRYAIYYEALPIDGDVIFYESMSGIRMMDNPYAIFKEVRATPGFEGRTHVWSMGAYETIPDEYKDAKNIVFVTRHTDAYLRYMASAGHVICNSVLPEYFVRKRGQKYLNTWHGIAYKRVGRNETVPLGAAASVYNMLQATHILSPCPFMTGVQLHGLAMKGVYAGEMAETGYPRIDTTINLSEARKREIRKGLGLSDGRATILYAPTWRSEDGKGTFDVDRLVNDLQALSRLDADVVFMGHHIMLKHIQGMSLGPVIVPPSSANTNELLGVVDVLVTDYSSIFFDFMVTGRPIVHYVYDYDEYVAERGLNLGLDELPGAVVSTTDELVEVLGGFIGREASSTERYLEARARFCPHEDGLASRRVIDWFFRGDRTAVSIVDKPARRSVVFWAGRLAGDRGAVEFLAKVRARAEDPSADVTVVIARAVEDRRVVMDELSALDRSITVIARGGQGMVASPEEEAARYDVEHKGSAHPGALLLHRRMYEREYRRVLGDAVFDESVEFEGNSRFWRELARHSQKNRDGEYHRDIA